MESRIPKTIHYIWLSGDPYDKVTSKCIKSWKNVLHDYEIIKWDYEKCKDIISQNTFAREAYSVKKWAFVSDYLRLYILYHYGGIYMDADVEVFKTLDGFLDAGAFTCYETSEYLAATLIGAEKNSVWIKMLLDYYDNRHFILEDGSYDMRPNPGIITNITKSLGFIPDGTYKTVEQVGLNIFEKEYFSPIDLFKEKDNCFTENTHAVHLFNGSWQPRWRRVASKWKKKLEINPEKLLGEKIYSVIVSRTNRKSEK